MSWSTFSAAAVANVGLTVDGSAFAFVTTVAVVMTSVVDSVTTRKICFVLARAFGVRPRRIVSASVVASNLVWWTQNSDPAATVRPHSVPSRRSAAQRE